MPERIEELIKELDHADGELLAPELSADFGLQILDQVVLLVPLATQILASILISPGTMTSMTRPGRHKATVISHALTFFSNRSHAAGRARPDSSEAHSLLCATPGGAPR
jgi:hypothetical protein